MQSRVAWAPARAGGPFKLTRSYATGAITVLGPLAVLGVLAFGASHTVVRAIELLIAIFVILIVARWPLAGLITMLVYLPFQQVLLATMYHFGTPTPILRGLSGVKEAVTAGLVVAAVRAHHRSAARFDRLDGLVAAFVLLVTLYLLAPSVVPALFSSSIPVHVRLLGWRGDALFLVAFLAIRQIEFTESGRRAVFRALVFIAVVVGAAAMFEEFATTAWNHFLVHGIELPRYDSEVLSFNLPDPSNVLTYTYLTGHQVVRVGSFLLSPLNVGFYLFTALAIGLERLTEKRIQTFLPAVCALVGLTLVFTATRAAILGGVVLAIVVLQQGFRRLSPGRVRLAVVLIAVGIAVAPVATTSVVGQRTLSGFSGGQDVSDHSNSVGNAFHVLHVQPQGLGLGTAAGVGNRFQVTGSVTTEDAYLQVGDELGIVAMILFILIVVSLLVSLTRAPPSSALSPSALLAAGAGLAVGGIFLQVWLDYPTALTFWSVAALCLPASRREAAQIAKAVPLLRVIHPAQIDAI